MDDIQSKLIKMSRNAPQAGYVHSGNFCVINLKEQYNISDYYVVDILENLYQDGKIRELDINYDNVDNHILSYKFR